MEEVYREFIELTKLPDNETKEKAMEEFFRKLNSMQMPEYFNWQKRF